jgi:hypothetical protein
VYAECEADQNGFFRASFSSTSQWLVAAEILGEVMAMMASRSMLLTSGVIPDVGHFGLTTLLLGRPKWTMWANGHPASYADENLQRLDQGRGITKFKSFGGSDGALAKENNFFSSDVLVFYFYKFF